MEIAWRDVFRNYLNVLNILTKLWFWCSSKVSKEPMSRPVAWRQPAVSFRYMSRQILLDLDDVPKIQRTHLPISNNSMTWCCDPSWQFWSRAKRVEETQVIARLLKLCCVGWSKDDGLGCVWGGGQWWYSGYSSWHTTYNTIALRWILKHSNNHREEKTYRKIHKVFLPQSSTKVKQTEMHSSNREDSQ